MNNFRVIIIGAGAAGIAAAARLLENNVRHILILEAEDRIGGRIFTSQIEGNLVEIGAEWIHGEKDNVVYKLSSKFNLADTSTMALSLFSDTTFYQPGNREIDKEVSRKLCHLYESIVYTGTADQEGTKQSLGDYFLKEYGKGIEELKREVDVSDALANQFSDIFEKWENSIDASDSWFETSLAGHFEYWECEGNILTVWKGNGYNTLFDLLEENPPFGERPLNIKEVLKLNKEVIRIRWNKKSASDTPNVIVECKDRSIFSADYVIFTCSLGVLKEKGKEMFQPSLSDRRLNAIQGLGFGTVDKIFLKFPYPWWKNDIDGFAFLWPEDDRKNDSSGWISDLIAFHPVRRDSSVLRGWVVGKAARRMESLTSEQVLDDCMELLKKFVGFKYDIPRAEAISRSSWYSNPHFRGSYSCRLLESEVRNVWASDLAQPEYNDADKPVILFAGEATHDHYFSTVHGAVESGRREADRLLNTLLSSGLRGKYEVVVVGAGISGLAAAKTLSEAGITDVIILEAQDAPGGRIRSVNVGNDWIELGAQWIHGDRNEVYELCKKHSLVTDQYSEEGQGMYLREDGTIVDEALIEEVDRLIKTVLENCEDYVSADDVFPSSVGEELLVKFNEYLNDSGDSDAVKELKKDLFYWHVRFHLIDNSCDDLSDLSAKAWGLYRFCGGNDYVNFKSGYKSLIDVLVTYIPAHTILYSTPVNHISWKESVHLGSQTNECNNHDSSVGCCATVSCNDISFNANYVIVTSSIGYLKNNHKKLFHPPLPAYLSEAIDSFGFGVLGKIFLVYEKPWWEPEARGFQLVWSHKRLSQRGKKHWSVDLTGFDVIIKGRAILLGWVAGDGARTIESMPEAEIGAQATEVLRKFTGNPDIPVPEKVLKSKWFSNEYVQGGYSHITVDYDKNGIDGSVLSRPVCTNVTTKTGNYKKPTILLAGEATHQTHYSTVHGAYESGVNQARIIINSLNHL